MSSSVVSVSSSATAPPGTTFADVACFITCFRASACSAVCAASQFADASVDEQAELLFETTRDMLSRFTSTVPSFAKSSMSLNLASQPVRKTTSESGAFLHAVYR